MDKAIENKLKKTTEWQQAKRKAGYVNISRWVPPHIAQKIKELILKAKLRGEMD